MTFTSAAGSGLRMQSGWRSRLRRHARWISGRRSATCARCRHPRPRATGRSRSFPSTPARGSPGRVALDVDDLRLSARRAILRIYGKGERVREVPIHPKLREALENWLEDRKRWPGSDNRALFVMRFYREFLPAAPRAVNGFFAAMTVPPADLFPEHLHLRKVCAVVWCVIGSEQEATRLLAPVHDIGTPLLHHVGPMPHPVLQSLFDGLIPKGMQYYWRADFVNELSDELIEQHLEWGQKLPSMFSGMHLYPIDGAAHDVGAVDTAFSYRNAQWAEAILGVDPDPANADKIRDWCVGYWEATIPTPLVAHT